ncbi:hypothetical protein [Caloramator proteoclasticus]|uniref:Uncharacterized protein n=1 Tax=Caloramator proteoclasticus DSM 10124 TaxID=1121262 RepID=A0A1M4WDA3_9CLOT|nr:hypothetical protein [Caloramator proteoclasticus]SHE79219.1 hypothetical protein SAMN02746091_01132 [Caloramator proteoclasticus DSM 10124]
MRRDLNISILVGTLTSMIMITSQKLNNILFLNLIIILITTFILSYPIKKCGVSFGFIAYFYSLILLYIFGCNSLCWIIYSFLGIYPIINYFIELSSLNRREKILFKFLWFNSILFLVYMVSGNIFTINITSHMKFITLFLFLILQVLFYLYDIIFTKIAKLRR